MMKKIIFAISVFVTLIISAPFSSAYFINFFISLNSLNLELITLEKISRNIVVTIDPASQITNEQEGYQITREPVCNEFDINGDCVDTLPNLCPYLSLQPTEGSENFDVGFPLLASRPWDDAVGTMSLFADQSDTWRLEVASPCFEGECPPNYNHFINGQPLPTYLKGQTFFCDLTLSSQRPPVLIKGIHPQIALAQNVTQNILKISAVLKGGPVYNATPDPVIIIPGIMGSAYKDGALVIDPILHTYDDLFATLDQNGYTPDINLFTFPYEWRDSNVLTAAFLRNKINEVQTLCDCDKVDLIAHSMGGLVARQYIQSNDYGDDVDQLIFLGTPHKGAPTDYLQWEAGKFSPDFNSVLRESYFEALALRNGYSTIFDYIHNKPISSVQELLPIFNYLQDKNTGITRTYPNNYPQNTFLETLNNNIATLLTSGVKITNIVGNSGENKTINTIRVIPTDHAKFWQHGEPDGFSAIIGDNGLERGEGDNTVTIYGATLNSSIPNENSNVSHNRIPTVEANKIYKILTGKDSATNIDNGTNISESVLLLQLLSPIDFVITAPDGKRVGKNFANGSEYSEIPNAFYSGYNNNDDEYITILNPLDGQYKIELQGTGSGGAYGVLTSYISDTFATTTKVEGVTAPNQITELNAGVNNQNPEILETERKINLEVVIADINGSYELGWIKDKKVRDSLIRQVKAIIKFEKKRNGKYETKVDKILIRLLNKELELLLKKSKINERALDLLKKDLEYLINNN